MELAPRVKELNSSPTLAITQKAKEKKSLGADVVSFGAGEPDYDTPSYIKDAAKRAIDEGFTKYTATSGIDELKTAIVEKFRRDNGLSYSTKNIIVSSGAKHSIYNLIQVLCGKGDEVIIPSPYWVSYPEMVKLAEATPVIVTCSAADGFKLTKHSLTKAVTKKTKLLILNSPSNPTGSVYDEDELKAIRDVALEGRFFILSDEIYEKLIYDDARHISIASLGEDIFVKTFVVNGVSKAYSMTGWRIGYLAGEEGVTSKVSNLQDHSTSNACSIAQKAALAALKGPDGFVRTMVDEYRKRRDYMVERLNTIGLRSVMPRGAFYVFSDISKTHLKSFEFSKRLLDECDVAVIPGDSFGAEGYARFSFATSMENIKKGLDRIERFVNGGQS